jgi:hypothetical protein
MFAGCWFAAMPGGTAFGVVSIRLMISFEQLEPDGTVLQNALAMMRGG